MPHYMFAPDKKNNLLDFQNQRYISIFMSLRGKERARAKARARLREREKEKERAKVQMIIFLNSRGAVVAHRGAAVAHW